MEQAPHAPESHLDGGSVPVLAGLDQGGGAARVGVGEPMVVDEALSAGVPVIGDDQIRNADPEGEPPSLLRGPAEEQWIRRPKHGMEIEQHVHGLDERADFASAVQFARSGAVLPSTAESQRRFISSSTKREAVGWRGSKRAKAARLMKPNVTRAARRPEILTQEPVEDDGAGESRSRASEPMSARCGPGSPLSRVVKPGMPVLPSSHGRQIGRGEPHVELRKRGLRQDRSGFVSTEPHTRPGDQTSSRSAKLADEGVAGVELAACDPFVRLVRLGDIARPADDGRDAGLLHRGRLPSRS